MNEHERERERAIADAADCCWSPRDRAEYECWLATVEPREVPGWVPVLAAGVRVAVIVLCIGGIAAVAGFMACVVLELLRQL